MAFISNCSPTIKKPFLETSHNTEKSIAEVTAISFYLDSASHERGQEVKKWRTILKSNKHRGHNYISHVDSTPINANKQIDQMKHCLLKGHSNFNENLAQAKPDNNFANTDEKLVVKPTSSNIYKSHIQESNIGLCYRNSTNSEGYSIDCSETRRNSLIQKENSLYKRNCIEQQSDNEIYKTQTKPEIPNELYDSKTNCHEVTLGSKECNLDSKGEKEESYCEGLNSAIKHNSDSKRESDSKQYKAISKVNTGCKNFEKESDSKVSSKMLKKELDLKSVSKRMSDSKGQKEEPKVNWHRNPSESKNSKGHKKESDSIGHTKRHKNKKKSTSIPKGHTSDSKKHKMESASEVNKKDSEYNSNLKHKHKIESISNGHKKESDCKQHITSPHSKGHKSVLDSKKQEDSDSNKKETSQSYNNMIVSASKGEREEVSSSTSKGGKKKDASKEPIIQTVFEEQSRNKLLSSIERKRKHPNTEGKSAPKREEDYNRILIQSVFNGEKKSCLNGTVYFK